MKECPCCSQELLRCFRPRQIYWFCPNCRQEMPDLDAVLAQKQQEKIERLNNIYSRPKIILKDNQTIPAPLVI